MTETSAHQVAIYHGTPPVHLERKMRQKTRAKVDKRLILPSQNDQPTQHLEGIKLLEELVYLLILALASN